MGRYFKNIWDGFSSTFEGMSITFSHLFRKPITIQYPDKLARPFKETMPERSRSFLKVDTEICTACLVCMNDCPIDCILIETEKDEATKQRALTKFNIDMAKCMYCGLCTDPCPTGAIHFVREFEKATTDISTLLMKFVPEGQKSVAYKLPRREKDPVPAGAEAPAATPVQQPTGESV